MRLFHSSQISAVAVPEAVRQFTARVNAGRLRATVEALAYPRHFRRQTSANQRAARWIAERLTAGGYNVHLQGPLANVVATPPGIEAPLTLVCSHYDTVPETPGADDNGSAVAAMLECAQVLQGSGAAVGFASFNCEEDGFLGSIDFVRQWVPQHRVAAVHVLEMVGFADHTPGSQQVPPELPLELPECGNFLGLLGNQDSDIELAKAMARARGINADFPIVGLEVPDGLERFLPVLLRSDHVPFWQAGIPTLMWTDTSEYRNPHYHQPSDTPETLDYTFLADVTRALVATVA